MRFTGFYEYTESRADSRILYQDLLKGGKVTRREEREISQYLQDLNQFPSNKPLERLKSHIMIVYEIVNPVWWDYIQHAADGKIKK